MNEKSKIPQNQEQSPFQTQNLDKSDSDSNPVKKSEFDYPEEPIGTTSPTGEVDHKSPEDNEIETTSEENLREKFKNFLGRKTTERSVRLEIKRKSREVEKQQRKNEKNKQRIDRIEQQSRIGLTYKNIYGLEGDNRKALSKVISGEYRKYKQKLKDLRMDLYYGSISQEEYLKKLEEIENDYKNKKKPQKYVRNAEKKLEKLESRLYK